MSARRWRSAMCNGVPDRLAALTAGPAVETRAGCRGRIAAMTMGDLMLLCSRWDCSVAELERRLHRPRRSRKKKDLIGPVDRTVE
jgi:hypothetical protein